MPDLEQQLTALAAELDWPPTPRLRASIPLPARQPRARTAPYWLGGQGWRLPLSLSPRFRRPLAVAAAALLIVAIALTAYPPSRDAIARWVNLHTTIQRVPNPPTPSPLPSGSTGERLHLGSPISLEAAQQKVTWKIAAPPSLGPPDEVYLKEPPSGPSQSEVALVYVKRPGITESRLIFFTQADGTQYFDTLRLAGNTLLFDDNGTLVRIEGDMTREQAIQLGASF